MANDFNIHTSFQGRFHIFTCPQREFLNKVAEYYKIDLSDVELYAVKKNVRHKISPHEIGDLMKIEIVDKSTASAKMDGQRTLRSYFGGEPSYKETFVESISTKLKNNTPLTGAERKYMIEWIEESSKNSSSSSSGTKRKLNDDDPKPKVLHKKVQAYAVNVKDSFAQTDIVNLSPHQALDEQEQTLIKIKKIAQNGQSSKEEISSLMKASFDDRRNFILIKIPPVAAIRDKYPLLFCVDEVKNELDRLFYPGKCVDFMNNMDKYSSHILTMCDSTNEIYIRTEKSMEKAHTLQQRKYAEVVGSVLLLPQLMHEELNFLKLQDNPIECDVYPYIDADVHTRKDTFRDNILYKLFAEGLLICEASHFKEAVLCLIAIFFIFNIDYPKSCNRTLIMFEKLYLDANDTLEIDDLTQQMLKYLKLKAEGQ